ncbi:MULTISPECIES: hypothetical protein [Haloferax]|uniref:hypothetical protein n=1 Tax=Haloferax TaxID=2251 RepID=UPI00177D0144|nr:MULTISPECIES: hypothetical protein [Haloferax]
MTGEAELETERTTESESETGTAAEERDVTSHLDDLEDGAGCTEIWSHLSESREE